ncbi:MAG: cell division protein FtsK [Chloroflexales bacterium]|nr:cell division protein FtsK [Chloroflexales bacterium]
MNPATGLTIQLALLFMLCGVVVYLKAVELYRQLYGKPQERPEMAEAPVDLSQLDPTPLAGAGAALAHPPADLGLTLAYVQQRYAQRRYTLPLGWQRNSDGTAVLVVAHLVDDVYHLLLTAKSRAGKDTAALTWLLTLALLNPPERLQVAILDGKGGLDWIGWKGKAHTWRLAIDRGEIAPAMEALSQERERRAVILREAGVSAWEGYQGRDLPLLVIYVSELLLLQDATSPKELERWLNSELSASGAFGMRYLVATQTAANFSTRWRGQVDLCVAGFQPSASQDQPNTGLTTAEIATAGGVPPSALPGIPHGRGVFTLVQGRQAETVRGGYLDDAQRRRWLTRLPSRVSTPPVSRVSTVSVSSVSSHIAETTPPPVAVMNPAMHGPVVVETAQVQTVSRDDTNVSPGCDAATDGTELGNASDAGNAPDALGMITDTADTLSDDAITTLLLAETPVRQIAARLRGRMQKRLARIAAIRARLLARGR